MNVHAKFENNPWNIKDFRVLTGLSWPAEGSTDRKKTLPRNPEGLPGKHNKIHV